MCLIISGVFLYLSYNFYIDGDVINTIINGSIAILFVGLLIRNILKTRKEKDMKS